MIEATSPTQSARKSSRSSGSPSGNPLAPMRRGSIFHSAFVRMNLQRPRRAQTRLTRTRAYSTDAVFPL
jgi:hypothetical protein